jgi:ATP-binding cassette, subfamily B, bacterial PglK
VAVLLLQDIGCRQLPPRTTKVRQVLDTWRKIAYLVGRDKPARWALLVVGALFTSGLEVFAALMVFLLLALIADPGGGPALPLLGEFHGLFAGLDDQSVLLGAAVLLGAFFVGRALVAVAYSYVKHRMAQSAGERLSSALTEGYLRLPYQFHLVRSSAEMVRNAHQTVESLAQQAFLSVIYVISEGLLVLALILVMVVVAPVATAMAVGIIGGAALLLLKLVQPKLQELGVQAQRARLRSLGTLQQSLYGIRDIKVLAVESRFGESYRRDRRDLARSLYLQGVTVELPRHVIETALIAFILLLFGFSVWNGAATEELLSTMGLFAYAGLRMMPSLQKFVSGLNSIKFSGAAVDQVHADLVLVESVLGDLSSEDLPFVEQIRLEEVDYFYPGADRPALVGANLNIGRGEVVGICGPTGGGKTTLTDLITGILVPTSGRVTVDGRDLQDRHIAWFRKLGVVPQMVFLIDDTLRGNIALGVPDEEVDEIAISNAIQRSQLHEFVRSLPDGISTQVGERGIRLSGGQRQRIAIARALYRRPEVLIFDEGTSALDNTTESALIESLRSLRGSHTILLVAHRLSTVRDCDKVVYIEKGRIADVGTYDELMQRSEGFRALARHA